MIGAFKKELRPYQASMMEWFWENSDLTFACSFVYGTATTVRIHKSALYLNKINK